MKSWIFIVGVIVIWNIIIIFNRNKKYEKTKVKIKYFNLGSSHSLCAFNYNLTNWKNLAENSQTFYYDYKILDRYFESLDEEGICFLTISYFSFAPKEYWLKTDVIKYYKILKISEFSGKFKIECVLYKFFPIIWSVYKKFIKEK